MEKILVDTNEGAIIEERDILIPLYSMGQAIEFVRDKKSIHGEIVAIYTQYTPATSTIEYEVWCEEISELCIIHEDEVTVYYPFEVEEEVEEQSEIGVSNRNQMS